VLSSHERRVWKDVERRYAVDTEELAPPVLPPTGRYLRPGRDGLPAAVVVGSWASVVLVLFGLVAAGLAVAALTALGALLLARRRPSRSSGAAPDAEVRACP
jgi:hypothetical protein